MASNLSCQQVSDGRADQVACKPIDITVKASAIRVVNGTAYSDGLEEQGGDPYPPSVPRSGAVQTYVSTPPSITPSSVSCKSRSMAVAWNISRVLYSGQGIRFLLTNQALNYTAQCNVQDVTNRIQYESPVWRNCTRYNNATRHLSLRWDLYRGPVWWRVRCTRN